MKKPLTEDPALPHSIEAEQAVLGAVLMNDKAWADVAILLKPTDWYRHAHGLIFMAMQRLKADGLPVDPVTVHEELIRIGHIAEVGGPVYLASLMDGLSKSTNVVAYAGIVREKSNLRDIIIASKRASDDAYLAEDRSASIVEAALSSLLAITDTTQEEDNGIGKAFQTYVLGLDDAPPSVIPTGYADIDALLVGGGLSKKEVAIVAARPSVGKTALALGIAKHAAMHDFPTAVFSLEMSREALVGRLVSWEARIQGARLAKRAFSDHDYERLGAAASAMTHVPLTIVDSASTLTQINAWCERLRQRSIGLALVVIDYLQLMTPEGRRSSNREMEVATLSRGLKRMAKEQGVALVALSQLSRAPEGRKDKRPLITDLRESGALEQDADVAILLFREEMHGPTDENRGIAEAIIAKQRNGPTGVVRLYFASDYAWFTDLATRS